MEGTKKNKKTKTITPPTKLTANKTGNDREDRKSKEIERGIKGCVQR